MFVKAKAILFTRTIVILFNPSGSNNDGEIKADDGRRLAQ